MTTLSDFANPVPQQQGGVVGWLYFIAAMIFVMVLIGGATRLTDSGLSITEWQLIMGIIPPLSAAEWDIAFGKYKLIPEFKIQNSQMTMNDFKFIFFWEWIHRFWGRLIGVAFAIPLLVFALQRKLSWGLLFKLIFILALGAAQAGLGWWMVKSGLADRTDVSQYRLAAHLTLAAVLFSAVFWVAYGVKARHKFFLLSLHGTMAFLMLLLVLLQIFAGGLVAGLDAGMGYATWPKMDGAWIPQGLDAMTPKWKNLFENALTVQFSHRILAYGILALTALHAFWSFRSSAMLLFYGVLAQGVLGILMLLLHLPLAMALAHQGAAMIVLALATMNLHAQTVVRSSTF
jgi:heme a synthase